MSKNNYKRNPSMIEKYKACINQCAFPDCKHGINGLEVHHIIPLSMGGTDTYDNYICVCSKCHDTRMLHSTSLYFLNRIFYNKIYSELTILGFDSSNGCGIIFGRKLAKFLHKNKGQETFNNICKFDKDLYLKVNEKVKSLVGKGEDRMSDRKQLDREYKYQKLQIYRKKYKEEEYNRCKLGYNRVCNDYEIYHYTLNGQILSGFY